MWKRCEKPNNLEHKQITLAIRANVDVSQFSGAKYIGYTRGCDAVIVAFDEFVKVKPINKPSSMPLRPKGSCSSSSESEDQQEVQQQDAMADYIQFALSNSSVTEFLETLKVSPGFKLRPKVYNWKCAKEVLQKEGWNSSAIEWWYSDKPQLRLPRLNVRTKFEVPEGKTGATALREAGILQVTTPLPAMAWQSLPARVRRFWRAILAYLAAISTRLDLPDEEICSMFDYSNNYLPAFWKFKSRKLLYIQDTSHKLPPSDRNYFIRLFDFAIVVRRAGIGGVWDYSRCALPARPLVDSVSSFLRVRYPWVDLPNAQELVISTYLDQACELLWDSKHLIAYENCKDFSFKSIHLQRTIEDCIEVCSRSVQLEGLNFGAQNRLKPMLQFGISSVDGRKVWSKLKRFTCYPPGQSYLTGPQNVNIGFGSGFNVKLIPMQCVPEFKKTIASGSEVADLNYVIASELLQLNQTYIPNWLLRMNISAPLLPICFNTLTDTQRQLMFATLSQDEEIWLSQRKWSQRFPIFRVIDSKLYINTGYAAFTRDLLKRKVAFIINKIL